MLTNGKTYYQVLGVLDDAESIVIRAAYRSLAAKYHPDKWIGDKQFANTRMTEINIAYDCLSDESRRRDYDKDLDSRNVGQESKKFEDEEQFETIEEDEETWNLANEFYPNLRFEYQNLSQINMSLANTYKIHLIKHQSFNKYAQISKDMAERYLERYFGSSADTRRLAMELLIRGEHKVARYLNEIVTRLGKSVSHSQIYELLIRKFPREMTGKKEKKTEEKSLWGRLETGDISADEAIEAITRCGFQVTRNHSFFGNIYTVQSKEGEAIKMSYTDLVRYTQSEILPIARENGWV